MNALSLIEEGDFFERRGREGFAEVAEEVKENEDKRKKTNNKNIFAMYLKLFQIEFFLGFLFVPSFLRPLRNLRALCVQKFPTFNAMTTSHPIAGAAN